MTDHLPRWLLLSLLLVLAAAAQAVEFTLPHVQHTISYNTGNIPHGSVSITLPIGGWIHSAPTAGQGSGLLYQGTQLNAPDAISAGDGHVDFLFYGGPDDTYSTFIYADKAPNFPDRQYGLCTVTLLNVTPAQIPAPVPFAGLYIALTDQATGAKVTGANVTSVSPASTLTEVGNGFYRFTGTTGGSVNFSADKSGYTTLNFSRTLTSGSFLETSVALINPTPASTTLTSTSLSPTADNPIPVTITFSKPVSGFVAGDLSVTNGTVASLIGGPSVYVAQIAPSGTGSSYTVQVSVPVNAAQDAAAIGNAASAVLSRTYDATGPDVTIEQALSQSDPAGGLTIAFTVRFSAPVTDFDDQGDVLISGPGATPFRSITGSGQDYTVTLSGMTVPGVFSASVASGAAVAAGGHPNRVSTSVDNSVTWAPPVYALPTINATLSYLTDGTPAMPPIPEVPPSALVTIALGANAWVVDLPAGRLLQLDTTAITVADTATTDSLGRVRFGVNTPNTDTYTDFVYSLQPPGTPNRQFGLCHITVINSSDVSLNIGGAYVTLTDAGAQKISGAMVTYGDTPATATLLTETGAGIYRHVITTNQNGYFRIAKAGYQSASAWYPLTLGSFIQYPVTLTQTGLGVTLSTTAANPTRRVTFPLTIAFSQNVSGFTAGDVVVTNGTFSGLAGGPAIFTGTVTPNLPGTVRIELPSDAARSTVGNLANNAALLERTFDTSGPTVTLTQAVTQLDPTSQAAIAFTAVFSAPVSGFTGSDVALSGSAGGTLTATVTGSGTTYTVSVTGMATAGTVSADLGIDAANSVAGNHPSAAATGADRTVTWSPPPGPPPTVTIEQSSAQPDPTPSAAVLFDVRFSAPVTGFAPADVVLSGTAGGTLTANVSGSGAIYTVLVGGMTSAGTVRAAIPAAVAIGNGQANAASTSSDDQVTYAPGGSAGPTPATVSGSGGCGLGSGLAAFFVLLIGLRRRLRG